MKGDKDIMKLQQCMILLIQIAAIIEEIAYKDEFSSTGIDLLLKTKRELSEANDYLRDMLTLERPPDISYTEL